MLKLQWGAPLNFPVMWQWSLTFSSSMSLFANPTSVTLLKFFFFFFSDDQFFTVLFHYFFTVFMLFRNCFNCFSCIFTSVNNNWLTKFIINTNRFVIKTTRNVILRFFWVRSFITFKISISFKWNWYLFKIIFKLNCSYFKSYRLCITDAQTNFFMFWQYNFTTKTL